jgi:tetratricopeptide (TPR) repeat protein
MRSRWLPLIGALALQTTPFCIAGPASARPQALAFVRRALSRCPNEPRLNLAAAVVAEQRRVATRQKSEAEAADVIRQYEVAMKFPETALESRARAAWLLHLLGKSAEAIELIEGHGGVESDRYARYLAELIRGQLLRSVGREADAAAALRAALVTWPGAQFERVALMTLLFSRGERQEAAALAQAIESSTDEDFDPWWTYWSGDYRAYPAIIDRLRELSRAQ